MIEMQMKALFFDSARVLGAMDAATRPALRQAGAFMRQRARTSTRKRKGVSRAREAARRTPTRGICGG